MDIIDTLPDEKKNEPWRFEGWLLLLGFGVVISPFRTIINLWTAYSPMFSDGTMEDIMVNGSLGFTAIIIIEIITNIGFLLLSVYLIKLLFQKKAIFPKWYLIAASCSLGFLLVDTLVHSLMFPNIEIITTDIIKAIASGAVGLLIWSPYLYKSERSKNTFIL